MRSKKVKQILGIGIIVVIIAGVVFLFTRLNKPAEQEQAMQTAPKFLTEETVADPSLVEEERTWEEVIPSEEMTLKTITDAYLHVQPFSDTDTTIKVPINSEFIEEATCFQGSVPLNWSKVTYNGTTGYVELCDTEYVLPEVEEEVVEVEENEESSGVSQDDQHSIVEVKENVSQESDSPKTDTTPTEKETTKKEETTQPTPAPTPTQNPNVTVKTEAEKQAEIQQSALEHLKSLGATTWEEAPKSDRGFDGFEGTGKHYGDAQ